MGVTINSWITDSAGWQTMKRMQLATFSGGWRFSGGGGVEGPEEVGPHAAGD